MFRLRHARRARASVASGDSAKTGARHAMNGRVRTHGVLPSTKDYVHGTPSPASVFFNTDLTRTTRGVSNGRLMRLLLQASAPIAALWHEPHMNPSAGSVRSVNVQGWVRSASTPVTLAVHVRVSDSIVSRPSAISSVSLSISASVRRPSVHACAISRSKAASKGSSRKS